MSSIFFILIFPLNFTACFSGNRFKIKKRIPSHIVQAGNANRRDNPCNKRIRPQCERTLSRQRDYQYKENLAFLLVLKICLKIR